MAKKKSTGRRVKGKAGVVTEDQIKRLLRAQGEMLLSRPNVTSVGIGYKSEGGKETGELSLQFTVERKIQPEALEVEGIPAIPAEIEFEGVKIPTDIVQRSFKPSYIKVEVQAKPDRKARQDPIRGGISVAHVKSTAGTLGAIVQDATSGTPVILSNWHVLSGAKGKPGDLIVQPGPFDDNQLEKNKVGVLLRSHLGIAGDCAIATIEGRKVAMDQLDVATSIDSVGQPQIGDTVVKSGRTTGVTYGKVSRVEALFKLDYEGVGTQTVGGFEIRPDSNHPPPENEISKGGDSGSAWIAIDPKSGKPTTTMLGLHFGGDTEEAKEEYAIASYAHRVFEKLEIKPFVKGTKGAIVSVEAVTANEALRTGFDKEFVAFEVPHPKFDSRWKDDLVGLNGGKRIDYCHFSVWLSASRKLPICVAWNIDGSRKKSLSRKGIKFVKDDRDGLDEYQIGDELYSGNDFDRGHVARRDDLVWGSAAEAKQANVDSFFFTNMTPQHKAFNQSQLKGKWGLLENAVLDDVVLRDLRVSIFGGPILGKDDPRYRKVKIPREFWKVVLFTDDEDGENKARAFILTQKDLLNKMSVEALELEEFRWYQVPLSEIESRVGVRFDNSLHRIDTKVPQGLGLQARLIEGGNFFS